MNLAITMAALATLASATAQIQTRYEVATIPRTPRDLHNRYSDIFVHGNRNAASHRWSTCAAAWKSS